jgi:predicted oxidoreductase
MARWTGGSAEYTPAQCLAAVKGSIVLGVTTFDVAAIYGGGENTAQLPGARGVEKLLGAALALEPGLRDQIEIVTKCSITSDGAQSMYDTSSAHILQSVERSLAALQTHFVDVLLIHRPDPLMNADDTALAFELLQREGKVKYFGVSNFTPSQIELLQDRLGREIRLVTNQLEISCVETKHLSDPIGDGALDQCQLARQRPMAYSPLAKLFQSRDGDEQTGRVLAALKKVAAEVNLPAPSGDAAVTAVAVAWLNFLPCSPLVVTGSSKPERVQHAIEGLSLPLSRTQWFAILEASRGVQIP